MLKVKFVFLSSIFFSGKRRGKERLIDVKRNQMIDIVIILDILTTNQRHLGQHLRFNIDKRTIESSIFITQN